jgi:hypothetical protein
LEKENRVLRKKSAIKESTVFVCQDFKAQSYKKIHMWVRSFVNPNPVAKAALKM